MMKKFLSQLLKRQLRLEHIIYCASGCKIELPLHKSYYKYRRDQYQKYLNNADNYL